MVKITIFEPHVEGIRIARPGASIEDDVMEEEGTSGGRRRWVLAPIALAAIGAVGYAVMRVLGEKGESVEIDEVAEVEA